MMEKKDTFSPRLYALGGLMAGAVLAALLTALIRLLPLGNFAWIPALCLYAGLMTGGWLLGRRRTHEEDAAPSAAAHERQDGPCIAVRAIPKILDTSAIIDGRVCDICKAGFMEGELVVPAFVLDELRHIADSADPLRRNRGRRGLDVLNRLQEDGRSQVHVEDKDYGELDEVDVKLLRLARDLGGAVLTNDYNLNKVAGVTGVPVLNINELAGALRPVVLPGEEMTVHLVREGREPGQGVAYLEDGTMVVVENGRRRVGETLETIVITVLQTSAGRMIFGRVKGEEPRAV